jgi:hypothetical protein
MLKEVSMKPRIYSVSKQAELHVHGNFNPKAYTTMLQYFEKEFDCLPTHCFISFSLFERFLEQCFNKIIEEKKTFCYKYEDCKLCIGIIKTVHIITDYYEQVKTIIDFQIIMYNVKEKITMMFKVYG